MSEDLRILVVGCGNMGASHARAYQNMPGVQVVGVMSRGRSSREALAAQLGGTPAFGDFDEAWAKTRPDAVCVATYPDTHASYARRALERGAHVFVEKPLATTVEDASALVELARRKSLALVVGYILRPHPAWKRFIGMARELGSPLVMRMNLNQQSSGAEWVTHKNLMQSMSPIVDCGVHYVDVMCQMTRSQPVRVHAIGARLSDEIDEAMYNYGQLQVVFKNGSVGWYEAGWGPMMSEEAFFVKDVIGPRGSVSLVAGREGKGSADVGSHTRTGCLRLHWGEVDEQGAFVRDDEFIDTADEPDHDELCRLEQEIFLQALRGQADMEDHWTDAVNSLRIVLAADESIRCGNSVNL